MSEKARDSRRSFLALLTGASSAVIGLVLAVPGIGSLLHPLFRKTVSFDVGESLLGPVDGFELGQPKKVAISANRKDAWVTSRSVTVGSVWVVKKADGFTVLSTVCPHLGCPVNHAKDGFLCPCHNSRFELQGTRREVVGAETNPAPRDMDVLEHTIREGMLYCSYQEFKSGISERVVT